MRSRYSGLGNPEEIYNRLRQVPVDYTNELKKVNGEKFAADLLQEQNTFFQILEIKYVCSLFFYIKQSDEFLNGPQFLLYGRYIFPAFD